MKKLMLCLFFGLVSIAVAQWVPVAVNTNTGDMRPLSGIGTNNWIAFGGYFSTNAAFRYTDSATQTFMHAQARDVEMLGTLVVSNISGGALLPDCSGLYEATGQYSYGAPVYQSTSSTWYLSKMTNGLHYYKISDRIGDVGSTYWSGDSNITSDFVAVSATGNVRCVSLRTNILLTASLASTLQQSPSALVFGNTNTTAGTVFTNLNSVLIGTNNGSAPSALVFGNTNTTAGTVFTNLNSVLIGTNSITAYADSSGWSTNPAISSVNASNFPIYNVSSLITTGRLVIGFGVFSSTNDVPAPANSNTWYVFAARVNNTNYLLGVDSNNRRQYIGSKP